MTNILPYYFFS